MQIKSILSDLNSREMPSQVMNMNYEPIGRLPPLNEEVYKERSQRRSISPGERFHRKGTNQELIGPVIGIRDWNICKIV